MRTFIKNNFQSVGELEVLLLLYANKEKAWSANDVEFEMRSSKLAAKLHLDSLFAKNLITQVDPARSTYSFSSKDSSLEQKVQELSEIYPTYHVSIITLIYEKRRDALHLPEATSAWSAEVIEPGLVSTAVRPLFGAPIEEPQPILSFRPWP